MTININWKKTCLIAFDVVLAIYLIMAFTSWNNPTESLVVCSKVDIKIADEHESGFLTSNELKVLLERRGIFPLSQRVKDIDPRQIEERLKEMPFVKTAQCYVTRDGHACITVTQRTPIVRVKSIMGDDYYIDDNGGIMPNSQYTSDMIIVTGYVNKNYACKYVRVLAQYLMNDDLWRNQVEQINVLPDKTIELVPRVGDHIINIGSLPMSRDDKKREDAITAFVDQQMKRLNLFYRYGLIHAGWNKYEYISLEFLNQIVCRKREEHNVVEQPLDDQPHDQLE